MRKPVQLLGIVMVLQGISGAIDHLAVQPFFGPFLNLFNASSSVAWTSWRATRSSRT